MAWHVSLGPLASLASRGCSPVARGAGGALLLAALALGGCERPELSLDHVLPGEGNNSGSSGQDDAGSAADASMEEGGSTTGGDASTAGDAEPDGAGNDDGGPGGGPCDLRISGDLVQTADGNALVDGVVLDGSPTNVVTVAPGDSVTVDFLWAAPACLEFDELTGRRHLVVGFEDDPVCAVDSSCLEPVPTTCVIGDVPLFEICDPSRDGTAKLTAPDVPGDYYIYVDRVVGASCSGWDSGPPGDAQRIAAVCVR